MAQTQFQKSSYWSLPFCADLLIYEIYYGFLNKSILYAIISTSLLINLQWVKKLFCCIRRNLWQCCFSLVSRFNLLQSFNNTPFLFEKKRFKSEINSFCIWTQIARLLDWLTSTWWVILPSPPPPPKQTEIFDDDASQTRTICWHF